LGDSVELGLASLAADQWSGLTPMLMAPITPIRSSELRISWGISSLYTVSMLVGLSGEGRLCSVKYRTGTL